MKTWSKYIILIITIFAIFLCKGESISLTKNHFNFTEQLSYETEYISTDFYEPFHHQIPSIINNKRIQKNSLRRDNNQRQSSYFIKTNKITNLYSTEYFTNKLTHKNTVLSEPSYRLIRLGKLII